MAKKYMVRLTEEEQAYLESLVLCEIPWVSELKLST
jgi:hypothetical protein